MAIPTVTTISPVSGPTGGRTLVEITGSGFRLPPPPPLEGPTTGLVPKTVEVLFGAESATDVKVISDSRLFCLNPISNDGDVDIVLKNLDNDQIPIGGEDVTEVDGYKYFLPKLVVQSDFVRLVRTLLREMKRQILPNVSLTVHTDFDADASDGLNLVDLAELPGLALIGPDTDENRFYSINQRSELAAVTPLEFFVKRTPRTVDLSFTIVGVSDTMVQLLNLLAMTELFFERNKFLSMDRDPLDPSKGQVKFEMDFASAGDLKTTGGPNISNIRSFSGDFVIRGFDLEGLAGIDNDFVVEPTREVDEDGVQIDIQQTGESFNVGVNPAC